MEVTQWKKRKIQGITKTEKGFREENFFKRVRQRPLAWVWDRCRLWGA
jgi:hypothetical protein